MKNKAYAKAGVDLDRGYEVVRRIKRYAKSTHIPGVMSGIGGFSATFDLKAAGFQDPIMVSGTDGVGTKLLLAIEANIHNTIGQDLVAMCVNDCLTVGARPLFFLDYFATGKINPEVVEQVIEGITKALNLSGAALVGGETAEMPDMYAKGHYDLGGFAVGGVERDKMLDAQKNVQAGDVLIAIPSSGIHSNGYSLVRKIFFKDHNFKFHDQVPYDSKTLIEELLTPTKIYTKVILGLLEKVNVHGMANITGGGFYENIPRMMKKELDFKINWQDIKVPEIFKWMQKLGNLTDEEMFSTFNMGVGMVVAIAAKEIEIALATLEQFGEKAYVIGEVIENAL